MSVYKNDDATFLHVALDSVIGQTLKPKEVVVVGDGPVPVALEKCIQRAKEAAAVEGIALKWLPQPVNRGLGEALRIACDNCSYDYIAMITEFVGSPDNIVDSRVLPLDNEGIYRMMQTRCGVNHVTVIIRKSDLMEAGNYSGRFRQEDFYLWARMMKNKVVIQNIPDVVVNVRSGADQFARRGGMKYFHEHMKVFKFMYHEGLISYPVLLENYCLRFAQVAFPTTLRTWVYQHLLRKQ